MSALYNEYLTGADREVACIIAESDAQFAKLNVLLESVNANLEANMLMAEAKVLTENGTYDDLTTLYTEANTEADGKKQNIFAKMLEAVGRFFASIGRFFTEKFGKDTMDNMPENVTVDGGFPEAMNAFEKAWATLKSGINKIKTGNILEGIKDILKAVAPATIVIGATAAAATVVVKRDDINNWLKSLKEKQAEVNTSVNSAQKLLTAGSTALSVVTGGESNNEGGDKNIFQKAIDVLRGYGKKILEFIKKISGWIGEKVSGAVKTAKGTFAKKKADGNEPAKESPPAEPAKNEEPAEPAKATPEAHLSKEEEKAYIKKYKEETGKKIVPKKEREDILKNAKSEKAKKYENKGVGSTNDDEGYDYDQFGESVSIFGIDFDTEELYAESEMAEKDFTELSELFEEL